MRKLVTALGNEIEVREDAERIISLSPAVTEILFELGLGDRLVGVSAFCSRPDKTASIRKVGSYGSARIEVIEELRPDIIYTISGYPEDFAERLSEKFPVYVFGLPSSVSGIVDLVNRVGIVSEVPGKAAIIERELLDSISGLASSSVDHTAYVEIDLGGPVSFGYRSYISDALSLLGLSNIYGGVDREWLVPDLESIKEIDPDIIFYEPKMYSKFTPDDLKELIRERGWDNMDAVKNGRIYTSPGPLDFIAHHGPAFIREVMPWMRGCINNTGKK